MPPLIASAEDELRDLAAIQQVAGALTEMSIKDMRMLKLEFERSRSFYEDIRVLYAMVRSAASMKNFRPFGQAPLPTTQGASIAIALTSNHRFYGSLNRDVVRSFLDGLWQSGGEGIMIGRTGRALLAQTPYEGRVQSIILNDDTPTESELRQLRNRLASYGHIFVHHPEFITVMTQRVSVIDLAAEAESALNESQSTTYLATHIFEPELDTLVQFFETGVRQFILSRIFFEAEVARTAARMMSMSEAEDHARKSIRERRTEIRHVLESIQSMRLLETTSFLKKWKQTNNK